jgi:hypothetical protein
MAIITFIILFKTTFTEAGIVPRGPSTATNHGEPPTQLINGVYIPLKWCITCNIYKDVTTKHCRDCDNCIEEFDHHCP